MGSQCTVAHDRAEARICIYAHARRPGFGPTCHNQPDGEVTSHLRHFLRIRRLYYCCTCCWLRLQAAVSSSFFDVSNPSLSWAAIARSTRSLLTLFRSSLSGKFVANSRFSRFFALRGAIVVLDFWLLVKDPQHVSHDDRYRATFSGGTNCLSRSAGDDSSTGQYCWPFSPSSLFTEVPFREGMARERGFVGTREHVVGPVSKKKRFQGLRNRLERDTEYRNGTRRRPLSWVERQ